MNGIKRQAEFLRRCGSILAAPALIAGWMMTCATFSFAAQVGLQWDPNTEPDLTGYRLYRSPHSLLSVTPEQAAADPTVTQTGVADPAATTTTVYGLSIQTLYFFRLTALDSAGNESGFCVDGGGNPAEVMVYLNDAAEARAPERFLSPTRVDGKNDVASFGPLAEEVTILDLKGYPVFNARKADSPGQTIVWNGKDNSGRGVPSGVYIARIKKTDGTFAYQSFAVAK